MSQYVTVVTEQDFDVSGYAVFRSRDGKVEVTNDCVHWTPAPLARSKEPVIRLGAPDTPVFERESAPSRNARKAQEALERMKVAAQSPKMKLNEYAFHRKDVGLRMFARLINMLHPDLSQEQVSQLPEDLQHFFTEQK